MNFDDYMDMLRNQLKTIENMFISKGINKDDYNKYIGRYGLSNWEARKLMYGEYWNIPLVCKERDMVELNFYLHRYHRKRFSIFNVNEYISMLNRDEFFDTVSGVEKMFVKMFSNRYGFNNIIYLPPKNNKKVEGGVRLGDVDTYEFYVLQEIGNDGCRKWMLDRRLEMVKYYVCDDIVTRLINIFKKHYMKLSKNNRMVYDREWRYNCNTIGDYMIKIYNMVVALSQPKMKHKLLVNAITSMGVYKPTEMDRFDQWRDDTDTIDTDERKDLDYLMESLYMLWGGSITKEDIYYELSTISF